MGAPYPVPGGTRWPSVVRLEQGQSTADLAVGYHPFQLGATTAPESHVFEEFGHPLLISQLGQSCDMQVAR